MTENKICPKCGMETLQPPVGFLGLGSTLWFCPECGHTESHSSVNKDKDKEIRENAKKELHDEFDEILKQINDNNTVLMLNEWRPKLLILLELIKMKEHHGTVFRILVYTQLMVI